MVRFENGTTAPETEAAPGPSFARDEHIQRLEHELRVTRERLQATIAELTTAAASRRIACRSSPAPTAA